MVQILYLVIYTLVTYKTLYIFRFIELDISGHLATSVLIENTKTPRPTTFCRSSTQKDSYRSSFLTDLEQILTINYI